MTNQRRHRHGVPGQQTAPNAVPGTRGGPVVAVRLRGARAPAGGTIISILSVVAIILIIAVVVGKRGI
jgi:hypothetical protein